MQSNRRSICRFGMVVLAVLLSTAIGTRAQAPSATPAPTPKAAATLTLESQFFKNILRDQRAIWTSPFHLQSRDARWLAPLGFGTGALIATDRQTGDAIARFHRQLKASRIISYAGSTYATGGAAATFYMIGRATHNERARETGLLAGEALINSIIVASALKEITQRVRPLGGRDRSEFFDGGNSFPSGHSIQAWSVATVIAHEYHDRPAVQIAAYGIASAVSVARFTGHKHYLSDLLVGSAMGFGIGKYVYQVHHREPSDLSRAFGEEPTVSKRWPVIAPQYDRHNHEYGLGLMWSF
jgi:membrane-associated phospholipid phosphatase